MIMGSARNCEINEVRVDPSTLRTPTSFALFSRSGCGNIDIIDTAK